MVIKHLLNRDDWFHTAFEFLYASTTDPDLSWQAKGTKSSLFLMYMNEADVHSNLFFYGRKL